MTSEGKRAIISAVCLCHEALVHLFGKRGQFGY